MASTYAGPIGVTIAYLLVYYLMMVNQLLVKTRLRREYKARGERFHRYFHQDAAMLAADRYLGNTLEHMAPFLLLLWLQATLVSPRAATLGGFVYVLCRASYPFAMGRDLRGSAPTRIMLATVPAYLVLAYFVISLALAAAAA